MLRWGGFSLELIKKSVETLERSLTSEEVFARLQAAKLILQLANAFPSEQSEAHENARRHGEHRGPAACRPGSAWGPVSIARPLYARRDG